MSERERWLTWCSVRNVDSILTVTKRIAAAGRPRPDGETSSTDDKERRTANVWRIGIVTWVTWRIWRQIFILSFTSTFRSVLQLQTHDSELPGLMTEGIWRWRWRCWRGWEPPSCHHGGNRIDSSNGSNGMSKWVWHEVTSIGVFREFVKMIYRRNQTSVWRWSLLPSTKHYTKWVKISGFERFQSKNRSFPF